MKRLAGFSRALAGLLILLPGSALAHSVEGAGDGFTAGVMHPLLGPDHLVAMVAVGLWGAQLGRPLLFTLPIAFPMMMAAGGLLAVAGVDLFGLESVVELGIAVSALVLGLAVAFAFRAPVALAVAMVAVFAVFHGYAHGLELPHAASPLPYGLGFVLMTGLLHAAGIVIGLLNDARGVGPAVVRGCGALVALVGVYFVARALDLAPALSAAA